MADQNPEKKEETKKKNPAPAAKAAKRRKKKGPSAAVKVPQGSLFCNRFICVIVLFVW
jgi:hypothetical protein